MPFMQSAKRKEEKQAKLMNLINQIKADCAFYKMYKLAHLKCETHIEYNDISEATARSRELNLYYYQVIGKMEEIMQDKGGESVFCESIIKTIQRLNNKFSKYKRKNWIKHPINPSDSDYVLAMDCIDTLQLFSEVQQEIKRLSKIVQQHIHITVMQNLQLSAPPLRKLYPPESSLSSTGSIHHSLIDKTIERPSQSDSLIADQTQDEKSDSALIINGIESPNNVVSPHSESLQNGFLPGNSPNHSPKSQEKLETIELAVLSVCRMR